MSHGFFTVALNNQEIDYYYENPNDNKVLDDLYKKALALYDPENKNNDNALVIGLSVGLSIALVVIIVLVSTFVWYKLKKAPQAQAVVHKSDVVHNDDVGVGI